MPFVYYVGTEIVATNFSTSGSANTEVDHMFVKPGTGRALAVLGLYVGGKASAATSISGISYRLKRWNTTSAAGGTAVTPTLRDSTAPAATFTAGAASAGVTSGTGGPDYVGGCISGAAGPGGWVAPNPDAMIVLNAGATKSIDLFSASADTGKSFEARLEVQE